MHVLGIELRLSVLAAGTFSQEAILPAQKLILHVKITKFLHLISIQMSFHPKW